MMKFNDLKFISLITCCLAFAIGIISPALANSEDLTVTSVKRLTHPAYRALNLWYGVRDPWNRDHTRLLIAEDPNFTDPITGEKGRGIVWGFVSDLKSWNTLDDYKAAAKPLLPGNSGENYRYSTFVEWSPFQGEENIVYLLYNYYGKTTEIRRLNLDTGSMTTIASYDPQDGTDVSRARLLGWTTDNTLIVNFDNESRTSGGYEINVQTGTRTRYTKQPAYFSTEGKRWPQRGHGHDHMSPDRIYLANYGADYGNGDLKGVFLGSYLASGGKCYVASENCYKDLGYHDHIVNYNHIAHVSWRASNDWMIGGDVGLYGGEIGPFSAPHLNVFGIYQIIFDRATKNIRHVVLLKKSGAGLWYDTKKQYVANWHSAPIPTLSRDGKQMIFMSTDGKYTYFDFQHFGKTPWGTEGIFLADLAPASQPHPDTISPTTPTNLTATANSASQITLSWNASTDNVGVAGYTIYRNRTKIATTSGTSYTDIGLSPSTTYTYAVSAFDAAGNESAKSNPVTVTTPSNNSINNITVRAKGSYAGGAWPNMEIRVNGSKINSVIVNSSTYTDYSFSFNSGTVNTIDIVFINDYYNSSTREDRNLWVDYIIVNNQKYEAELPSTIYDRGYGSAAFDGRNVIPGQESMLWNGALRFKLSATQTSDIASPSAPSNLKATSVTSATVTLSWTASTDNVGVAGYKIYRNGVQVSSTTGTTFKDTGLLPATSYTYYVMAFDDAGNNSQSSNSILIKTVQNKSLRKWGR